MVGKGGLPPPVECHSILAGVNHLPNPETLWLECSLLTCVGVTRWAVFRYQRRTVPSSILKDEIE